MSTQYPAQPQAPVQQQPAGIATASVVLGAVGFVVGICSVIGLILGLVARGKAKRGEINPRRVTAGIVVSAISLALGVIGWIALFAAIGSSSDVDTTTTSSVGAPAVTAEAPVVGETPAEEVAVTPSETAAPVETTEAAPAPAPTAPVETSAPAAAPASGASVSQKNAVRTAEGYLDYSAFSRSGLIDQLEYEGFSTEDATYAVDNITVDYNEQAAKAAADYLEYSSFSRSGLIEQLEYEGYSASEAEFGVSQTGL